MRQLFVFGLLGFLAFSVWQRIRRHGERANVHAEKKTGMQITIPCPTCGVHVAPNHATDQATLGTYCSAACLAKATRQTASYK